MKVWQQNINQQLQPHCKGTQGKRTKPTFAKRLQVLNISRSNIFGQTTDEIEIQQLTGGLAKVGLDGSTINILSLLYFGLGLTNKAKQK